VSGGRAIQSEPAAYFGLSGSTDCADVRKRLSLVRRPATKVWGISRGDRQQYAAFSTGDLNIVTKANQISLAILRSPILWGTLLSLGFYSLIHAGIWQDEFAIRYFAGHWVEYVETAMFFVGFSWLVLKGIDVARQTANLQRDLLPLRPAKPQPASEAASVLAHIASLPDHAQQGYLPRRLREALEAIQRAGSADKLDDELKYLADLDAGRASSSYALVRIVVWAIPILGFLGTVIGITLAIARLSPDALEESLSAVTGGLGVAFDTTALALGLSMVLMFGQFLVERMENRLLGEVDALAPRQLSGRFEQSLMANDPQMASVERMAQAVIGAMERLVERQAQIWQSTIEAAHARWNELTSVATGQMEAALAGALSQSIQSHADRLATSAQATADSNRQQWSRIHQALAESADTAKAQQTELVKQGDILLEVIQASGQVARLEQTLNSNLAALAGAQHFEETWLNLAGAINLLNARLGQVAPVPHVDLREHSSPSKAA
jgi:biopolymer transport protein ExbB/TolQ